MNCRFQDKFNQKNHTFLKIRCKKYKVAGKVYC